TPAADAVANYCGTDRGGRWPRRSAWAPGESDMVRDLIGHGQTPMIHYRQEIVQKRRNKRRRARGNFRHDRRSPTQDGKKRGGGAARPALLCRLTPYCDTSGCGGFCGALEERQQIGIYLILKRRRHAMRSAWVVDLPGPFDQAGRFLR